MTTENAVVLLSGGMDSVAALHWAYPRYRALLAILFDYGQPNADQELPAGGRAAEALGVVRLRISVADTLPSSSGILGRVEDHDGKTDGLSPAFVSGRNLVFLTSAAAHAACHWRNGNIDVIIGANKQDQQRFPDCRIGTLLKLGEALRHGIGRELKIVAPWIDRTKAQILNELDDDGLNAAARSWSCYRRIGPCGKCGACVARREAFLQASVPDMCEVARMTGGDPSRGFG